MPQAMLFAMQAMQMIPQIISTATTITAAVQSATAHVEETNAALKRMQDEKRDPTAEEWAAQAQQIADLRARLHDANA